MRIEQVALDTPLAPFFGSMGVAPATGRINSAQGDDEADITAVDGTMGVHVMIPKRLFVRERRHGPPLFSSLLSQHDR